MRHTMFTLTKLTIFPCHSSAAADSYNFRRFVDYRPGNADGRSAPFQCFGMAVCNATIANILSHERLPAHPANWVRLLLIY